MKFSAQRDAHEVTCRNATPFDTQFRMLGDALFQTFFQATNETNNVDR